MTRALQWLGQAFVLALIMITIGVFADTPTYTNFPADQAMIRLSFSHGGARDCRARTPEELAALPPNMRAPQICSRGRLPVRLEVDLDGSPLVHADLPPGGLRGDGPSRIYEGFAIAPGRYTVDARLRDSASTNGFDWTRTAEITLEPRQNLVIEFKSDAGGFVIQ
jgi:hypothetical protein